MRNNFTNIGLDRFIHYNNIEYVCSGEYSGKFEWKWTIHFLYLTLWSYKAMNLIKYIKQKGFIVQIYGTNLCTGQYEA